MDLFVDLPMADMLHVNKIVYLVDASGERQKHFFFALKSILNAFMQFSLRQQKTSLFCAKSFSRGSIVYLEPSPLHMIPSRDVEFSTVR
jgi:hypothetical protein